MGNKVSRKKVVVDEQFTKPQGMYPHDDVDLRRLKKLIVEGRLAPCHMGKDEGGPDLEDCPICLLSYPCLNRSQCCGKGVCTECFLQLRPPPPSRTVLCPFCKTPAYAVEFRGEKTAEERGAEQEEEQKLVEAKIRMLEEERRADKERQERMLEDPEYQRRIQHQLLQQQFTLMPTTGSDEQGEGQAQGQGLTGSAATQQQQPGSTTSSQAPAGSQAQTSPPTAPSSTLLAQPSSSTPTSTSRSTIGNTPSQAPGDPTAPAPSTSRVNSSNSNHSNSSNSSSRAAGGSSGGRSKMTKSRTMKLSGGSGVQPSQLLLPPRSTSTTASASARASTVTGSNTAGGGAPGNAGASSGPIPVDAHHRTPGTQQQQQQRQQQQEQWDDVAAVAAMEHILDMGTFSVLGDEEDGRGRGRPFARLTLSPEYNALHHHQNQQQQQQQQQQWLIHSPRDRAAAEGGSSSRGRGSVLLSSGESNRSNAGLGGGAVREGVALSPPRAYPASRLNLVVPRNEAQLTVGVPEVLLGSSAAASSGRSSAGREQTPLAQQTQQTPQQQQHLQHQQRRVLLHQHHHQHVHQHIHEHLFDYPFASERHTAGQPHLGRAARNISPEALAAVAAEAAVPLSLTGGSPSLRAEEREGMDLEEIMMNQAILASLQDQPGQSQREAEGQVATTRASVPAADNAQGMGAGGEAGVGESSNGVTSVVVSSDLVVNHSAQGNDSAASDTPSGSIVPLVGDGGGEGGSAEASEPEVPGSFEDQMRLAIALSLVDSGQASKPASSVSGNSEQEID